MLKKLLIAVFAVGVLGGVYYLASPLFIDIRVDDALPDDVLTDSGEVKSGEEMLSAEEKAEMERQSQDMQNATQTPMADPMPNEAEDVAPEMYPVMGSAGHPASGHVRLLETESGTVIRYEDFSTINGPKLHVYLAKDLRANDYIDLGPIKGTSGNINYTVPEDVDLSEYRYVMYWCVPFSVLFNYADIASS